MRKTKQQPIEDEEIETHYQDEEDEEEIEGNYYDEANEEFVTEEPIQSKVNEQELEHVSTKVFKPQWTILHIHAKGTPEQFAKGDAETIWELAPNQHNLLKLNIATENRANVGEEHLKGDPSMIIPMDFIPIKEQNTSRIQLDLMSNQMMSKSFHKTGEALWVLNPNTTNPLQVNHSVFEPTNVITENAHDEMAACTLKDLDESIRIVKNNGKPIGEIVVNSHAHKEFIKDLDSGKWIREYKLSRTQQDTFFNAAQRRMTSVSVPVKLATELKDQLSVPIKKMMDRCIKSTELKFEFKPSDGAAWNSPDGLVGSIIGEDCSSYLNQIVYVALTGRFEYMLGE